MSSDPSFPASPAVHADHPRIKRFARPALAISMLVMGGCGIIYEYALGSLGNNLMGTSHEQIYVIIGLMMFAMGVGASAQRFIKQNLIDNFLLVETALGLIGGCSIVLIYGAYAYLSSYQLLLYGCSGIIGFLIGIEIPLLVRINEQYQKKLSINLGDILFMDYVGSLIGALLFAFILITRVGLEHIALFLGLSNLAVALVGAWLFAPLLHAKRTIFAAIFISIAILTAGAYVAPALMADFEQRTYEDPIIFRETSRYQHIVLTKKDDSLRMYINGQLQFDSTDEHRYHEMLVHMPMSLATARQRVLILGGGDGLALRDVLRYPDVAAVTLIDLDPMITRLATEQPDLVQANHGSLRDARVHTQPHTATSTGDQLSVQRASTLSTWGWDTTVYHTADVQVMNIDADQFLRSITTRHDDAFDVVIIDFPDPNSLEVAKLYSLGFYKMLKRVIDSDTLISCQSGSPLMAKPVFDCIGVTMQAAGYEVLPYHAAVPSFGHWGWHLAQLADLNSSNSNPNSSSTHTRLTDKLASLQRIPVHCSYVNVPVLKASACFGTCDLPQPQIEVTTRFKPVILEYFRQSWKRHG